MTSETSFFEQVHYRHSYDTFILEIGFKEEFYFPVEIGTRQSNKAIPGIRIYIYFDKDISKVNCSVNV